MTLYTSLLTAGTNSHAESSENANAVATDLLSPGVHGVITNTSGVAPTTGDFGVNAQASPNMTVAVNSGIAYVTATPSSQNSQNLRVRNTASANVTISANSSGSTKYDYVYVSVDATKAANPASDASDVATLVVSRSSSNTTDNGTPPTYGTLLAIITVANGASSITNSNITDKRVRSVAVGGINDTNGNEVIKVSATASAVNEVTVTNAATGNSPQLSASGDDANIGIKFAGKGTGSADFGSLLKNAVLSQANAGSAGGTMYYINLGGIKLLWCHSASVAVVTTGSALVFTLPASFFTTVQMCVAQSSNPTVTGSIYTEVDSYNTSSVNVKVTPASNQNQSVDIFVMGT